METTDVSAGYHYKPCELKSGNSQQPERMHTNVRMKNGREHNSSFRIYVKKNCEFRKRWIEKRQYRVRNAQQPTANLIA